MEITILIMGIMVLSGNIIQYLLHSRCKTIKCGECCEIVRDVVNEDKIEKDTIKQTEMKL